LRPKRDDRARVCAAARSAAPCGAPQNRLIRTPQRTPPTNELCQYTGHGSAPATRSRAAKRAQRMTQSTTTWPRH
jgi:hypothetical protein